MSTTVQRARPGTAGLLTGAAVLALAAGVFGHRDASAQQARGRSGQAETPIDVTGYWVSVVTEDWRWRMITAPPGDHSSVPLNVEGRRLADSWNPAVPVAAADACKAYGAAGIMRMPGRLHITWENPDTLKIDTDAGQQTRLLRFGGTRPPAGGASWQGQSIAAWRLAGGGRAGVRGRGSQGGSLTVETTRMRAGYLRKNGVPYSAAAVLTEYFDRHDEPSAGQWLTVVSVVRDPKYLFSDFITSTHFKREPDGAKWRPTPCTAG